MDREGLRTGRWAGRNPGKDVVRHDIWDYDAPNPTILFDAEFDGLVIF